MHAIAILFVGIIMARDISSVHFVLLHRIVLWYLHIRLAAFFSQAFTASSGHFDQWPACASARRMATETASRSKVVTSVLWGPKYLCRCLIGLISFWHPLPYRVQPFFFTASPSNLLFQIPMLFAHGRATGSILLMMKAHKYSV